MLPELRVNKPNPDHLHIPNLWGEFETINLEEYCIYTNQELALKIVTNPKYVGNDSVMDIFLNERKPHRLRTCAFVALGKDVYPNIRSNFFDERQRTFIDLIVESMEFQNGVYFLDLFKIIHCTTDYVSIPIHRK